MVFYFRDGGPEKFSQSHRNGESGGRIIVYTRLCSKENFREPFGLPSILVKAPRPYSQVS